MGQHEAQEGDSVQEAVDAVQESVDNLQETVDSHSDQPDPGNSPPESWTGELSSEEQAGVDNALNPEGSEG